MAAYDDLNTNRILTVGIISIVVTAVTALAVQVVYYALLQWHQEKVTEESNYRRQNDIIAAQTAEISDYGVDPDTGNYTIPIEQTMEMMVAAATKHSSADEQQKEKHDGPHESQDHKTKDHEAKDAQPSKPDDALSL